MNKKYPAFSVFGIEIEFMIVDSETLEIAPIADLLIKKMAGEITQEFECGSLAVNNELALHVIELKTNGPKKTIYEVNDDFVALVRRLNKELKSMNAVLLPTGMHPWYLPTEDVKLWPHGERVVYESYHRIFNCRGHGWSNLQSTHLNLPFSNEKEFVDLHAATRLLLPFIPALTASTPFVEGKRSSVIDARLSFYGKNQQRIPSISGSVIPEHITSIDDYHQRILQPMYKDIAPLDEFNVLQDEWLNSRGVIARFERDALEIRVIDTQECIQADLACANFISVVLQQLMKKVSDFADSPIHETELRKQYDACIEHGMDAPITDKQLIEQLQFIKQPVTHAKQVWQTFYSLFKELINPHYHDCIELILDQGNLAHRLITLTGDNPDLKKLHYTYKRLTRCLEENKQLTI